jgi:protein kinase C substrate 80K-H
VPPSQAGAPFSKRGVHPDHPIKTDGDLFKCADGKSIPTSHLNDEYCDCDDGEDEPGTSACSVSRERVTYYCGWQHASRSDASDAGLDHMLFPSRVNDGVCDCCDGNDEVGLAGSTSCLNTCGSALLASAARKATFAKGSEIRVEYVREGKRMHSGSDRINYGKDSGFRKLAERCWDHRGGNFMYHVCPFKLTTQTEIGHSRKHVEISKQYSSWKGDKVMVASQGAYCQPIRRGRSTEIHFTCGTKDKILSVEEFETCVYKLEMETPAACF